MKKVYSYLLCLVFIPCSIHSLAQSIIWEENFSSYSSGTGIDNTGNSGDYPSSVSKWTLSIEGGSYADLGQYCKTVNNKLEACNTKTEVVWESENIDISSFNDVLFTVFVTEDGDMESADYLNLYYSTDGGTTYTLIANWSGHGDVSHTLTENWNTAAIAHSGINANSLKLKIEMKNSANTEKFRLETIKVFTATSLDYTEDFTGQDNKGVTGGPPPSTDLTGVNWYLDIKESDLTDSWDYFKVDNGQFTARDVNDEQIWYSPHLDVSGQTEVNISIDVSSSDGLESTDYLKTGYILNGGDFISISEHQGIIDGDVQNQLSVSVAGKECIQIVVKAKNNAHDEFYYFDKVLVKSTASEPSNHASAFTASATDYDVINLSWTDNNGTTQADSFLIKVSDISLAAISTPVDGVVENNDTDLSDGDGTIRVANGEESVSWTGFDASTTYYFKIFPYTNFSSSINYKTDGSIPEASATTDQIPPMKGDLIITRITGDGVDGNCADDDGYMQIYNSSSSAIDLSNISVRYFNNGSKTPSKTLALNGNVAANDYIVITQNKATFLDEYGVNANFEDASFYFNGGTDGVEIYYTGAKSGVIDEFNDNGAMGNPWSWNEDYTYERNSHAIPGSEESNWTINTDNSGTPFPVELLAFTATWNENFYQISWTTSSEINNDYFTLERSEDMETWNVVTTVDGAGNSNQIQNYQVKDYEILEKPIYYRLKQTDLDGQISYSAVIAVDHDQNVNNLQATVLDCDKVLVSGALSDYISIEVYSITGKLLYSEKATADNGIYPIDISGLAQGMYILRIRDNYCSVKLKLLK